MAQVCFVCAGYEHRSAYGGCGVHTLAGTCVFIQIYSSPASGRVLLGFIGVASAQAKPLLLCG